MKALARKRSKISQFTPAGITPILTSDKNIISQANMTTTMGSLLSPNNEKNDETSG
jgi:hypothetical protein